MLHSIIELETPETKLYLDRSGDSKKVVMPVVPYVILDIPRSCDREYLVSGESRVFPYAFAKGS